MPVKTAIQEPVGVFFITFTCHQWKPLIEITNSYDSVYKWFDYLRAEGHFITGYVIMPNHIHALIAFRDTGKQINTIIGNGKRFLAYEIIKRLKERRELKLLHQLSKAVNTKNKERNKRHEVWEDSFDWKECKTNAFMEQKLFYMHNNPCRGKWNLSVVPFEYRHSSSRLYMTGNHAAYPVLNFWN